ncbi:Aminotransferase class I and II [Catalinimonas alkaloidigena]|uniref:Aminotransferase class I and II n=2 Tax=Catalinimonas alkaloidigena TaxID=1075417 RepID=A0A1G9K9D0_9BACT|nr:Aminotransferase class I and II [Catalinimonas alkaloidigena]
MHQEDACLVSSGTLAGQLALRLFEEMPLGHTPGTHPALYRLETRSSAGLFDEWLSQLHKALAQQPQSHWVLLCNSVDPLFAREVRFDWLADLPTDRTFTLLVDDSHGIGLLGPDGGGIGSVLSMPPHIELVVVASLNKALGLPGGVIAGPRHHLEQLRQHPVYNGASPLGPAWLHAFLQSKALYQHQRLRLQDNVRRFMESAPTSFVYRHTEPLPVFAFNQHELVAALAARQILVPSFHYPTTADPLITRLVLTSAHTDHDLDQLVSGL